MYLGILGLSFGTGGALGSDVGQADVAGGEVYQMLYIGYPLKLSCNLTDPEKPKPEGTTDEPHPPIQLEWFKDGEPLVEDDNVKIFQDNSSLVVMMPVKADAGEYKCRPKDDEDAPSKTIRAIYLELKKMDKSATVVETKTFVVECEAEGIPPPTIYWLKDQKNITDLMVNDSRISLGPNKKEMLNGTLTIADSQFGDRGNYSCIVTSLMQSYEKWTFLRVKDVYAALWPFIGIVIEVVILGIIIIIFEKRRAKAEFDESDTDQGNDQ